MDWLLARQARVERALAARHLAAGSLVLYDVSSTYLEGSRCPLARHGYSRDHRPDRAQVVFGLVTDERGCPVAVEAFPGNTADPATLEAQLDKLRDRFGLAEVVLVGDRGMLTSARIERLREIGGIGWVSCLRAPAIRRLVDAGDLQLGCSTSATSPRSRAPTSRASAWWSAATRSSPRSGRASARSCWRRPRPRWPGRRAVGAGTARTPPPSACGWAGSMNARKMAKHFELDIAEGVFALSSGGPRPRSRRRPRSTGCTSCARASGRSGLDAPAVVETYKRLSAVERDFRALKGDELAVRPIFHWREDRVRAHLFLCLLAAYVRWHLEAGLGAAPVPRRGTTRAGRSGRARGSARRAPCARTATTGRPTACRSTASRTLLAELATLTRNRVVPAGLATSGRRSTS